MTLHRFICFMFYALFLLSLGIKGFTQFPLTNKRFQVRKAVYTFRFHGFIHGRVIKQVRVLVWTKLLL